MSTSKRKSKKQEANSNANEQVCIACQHGDHSKCVNSNVATESTNTNTSTNENENENLWFDNLVKYLVARNSTDNRIDPNILEDVVTSFVYITYEIPRFVDLLPILCSARNFIDEFDNLEENIVGDDYQPCAEDAQKLNDYVLNRLNPNKVIDLFFVDMTTYILVQFDDFRDCVQVLAQFDQHCGEYQQLIEREKEEAEDLVR
jgi:hypothetical protein